MSCTIVLIGFMGSGKTKLGQYAAKALNMGFADTDDMIEELSGCSISEIFAKQGEAEFRRMETQVLQECCAAGNMILATGGGIVKNPKNIELIRSLGGVIVWLKATAEETYDRLKEDTTRPLLADVQGEDRRERIRTMMTQRHDMYESAADLVFDEEGIPLSELWDAFVEWICNKILKKDEKNS